MNDSTLTVDKLQKVFSEFRERFPAPFAWVHHYGRLSENPLLDGPIPVSLSELTTLIANDWAEWQYYEVQPRLDGRIGDWWLTIRGEHEMRNIYAR